MSRSRSRLAADWFSKLRQNAVTNEVEHTNVTDVAADVTTVSNTALHSGSSLNAANLTGTLPAIDGSALTGVGASTDTGAVGTYAYLLHKTRDRGIIQGSTHAGSSMVYSGQSTNSVTSASGYSVGHGSGCATASGTWRAMGSRGSATGYDYFATLFVRIS